MLLCAESQGRREILLENLAKADLFPEPIANWRTFSPGAALGITVAPSTGYLSGCREPALVCEAQLFGQRVAQRRRRHKREETDTDAIIRDLTELRRGCPWCISSTVSAATWAFRSLRSTVTPQIFATRICRG